jgi:hypothetical protein
LGSYAKTSCFAKIDQIPHTIKEAALIVDKFFHHQKSGTGTYVVVSARNPPRSRPSKYHDWMLPLYAKISYTLVIAAYEKRAHGEKGWREMINTAFN